MTWPRYLDTTATDRLLVVLSDIEMGAGGSFDDFPHSQFLGELILSYNAPPFDNLRVDLVFNGDTFDLMKTSYLETYPHHITSDVALGKMARVAAAHPRFFEALRRFLGHPNAERHAHFVVGNHDFELLFEEVQSFILSLTGHTNRVHFPGFELDIGRVHIEHGHQQDTLFRVDPKQVFIQSKGDRLLNIPWGTVGLLDVIMPLQPLLHFHDRLVPKSDLLQLMPEIRDLMVQSFWSYWTRDYWKGFFGRDPIKRLTWTMVKEIAARFWSVELNVSVGDHFIQSMRSSTDFDVYCIGHIHEAGWWSFGNRKVLQNGCFRNEYALMDEGHRLQPLPKSYTEIYMSGANAVRSHMIEIDGPPAPSGYIPQDIFAVLPQIRQMLAPADKQSEEEKARREQEAKEAQEGPQQPPTSGAPPDETARATKLMTR